MEDILELIATLFLGLFFFLNEEFSDSPTYGLLAMILPLLVTYPLAFILFRRGKPFFSWFVLGALQAVLTAIIRPAVVYGGYFSYLRGVDSFTRLGLDSFTYFLFALSGGVAGAFIVRWDPKGWLRILPLLGISLGVLYHYKVAEGFWSPPLTFRGSLLLSAEFFAPSIYGCFHAWYARVLRKRFEEGYMNAEKRDKSKSTNLLKPNTNSCAFILFLRNESLNEIDRTIQSIVLFSNTAYDNFYENRKPIGKKSWNEIVLVCGEAQEKNLPKLREYQEKVEIETKIYYRFDWDESSYGTLQLPEIFILSQRIICICPVMCFIEPGKIICAESFDTLAKAIEAVNLDDNLLVVSHDGNINLLPPSAVISKHLFELSKGGLLNPLEVVRGVSVTCKKKFFGGICFEKTRGKPSVEPDVPWLIALCAAEVLAGRKDAKLIFSKWIIN